jgi:hypothetical protein
MHAQTLMSCAMTAALGLGCGPSQAQTSPASDVSAPAPRTPSSDRETPSATDEGATAHGELTVDFEGPGAAYTCNVAAGGGDCSCAESDDPDDSCKGMRAECAARGSGRVVCTFAPGDGPSAAECACCWGDHTDRCDRLGGGPHPE